MAVFGGVFAGGDLLDGKPPSALMEQSRAEPLRFCKAVPPTVGGCVVRSQPLPVLTRAAPGFIRVKPRHHIAHGSRPSSTAFLASQIQLASPSCPQTHLPILELSSVICGTLNKSLFLDRISVSMSLPHELVGVMAEITYVMCLSQ